MLFPFMCYRLDCNWICFSISLFKLLLIIISRIIFGHLLVKVFQKANGNLVCKFWFCISLFIVANPFYILSKMGKIRQKRHAFHTAAPKLEGDETATNLQSSAETLLRPITTSNLVCMIYLCSHKRNIFLVYFKYVAYFPDNFNYLTHVIKNSFCQCEWGISNRYCK